MASRVPRIDEAVLREQVVEVCRRMHDRGLISGGEGNVTARLSEARLLVTPSGINKGFLKPAQLVVVDLDGRPATRGAGKPSSEVRVHLAAYRARPEVGAVVHAHPPTAVALTLAGVSLAQCLVPEAIVALGEVPTASYATPSTDALALGVQRLLADHNVVMMDRHGSVTLGADPFEAYDRLESLEHTARITWLARSMGPVHPLPAAEVDRLRAMAEAMGLRPPAPRGCHDCGGCGRVVEESRLVETMAAEVLRKLGRAP